MRLPQKLSSAQAYVTKEIWNDLIDYIRSLQIVPSVNIMPRVTSQGTYLVGYAASKNSAIIPEELYPWKIINIAGTGTPDADGNYPNYEFSVYLGKINGIMPPNLFDNGKLAMFTASGSSVVNVILKAKSNGKEITSASVETSSSVPTPKAAEKFAVPTDLDILLAVFYKGTVFQIEREHIYAAPAFVGMVTKSSVTAGEYPYELYFNWKYNNGTGGGGGGGGGGGFY